MSDNVKDYSGASIEVLKGLEPVRRRPGMYTDTQNPNHLGMEVIDNSVDEAVAGFANKIDVVLYEDESLEVTDNGRGMPVDLHPEEKIPAIELILTKLHAGGKFNSDSYKFSGGLEVTKKTIFSQTQQGRRFLPRKQERKLLAKKPVNA